MDALRCLGRGLEALGFQLEESQKAALMIYLEELLRWGQRIEYPGVMDLIETSDVIEKLTELSRKNL